jgi:cell wall-associated NlpC family hydrolase
MSRRIALPLYAIAPLLLASAAACAQPGDDDDPLGRLMLERGWVGSGAEAAPGKRAGSTRPARRAGNHGATRTAAASQGLVRQARDRGADLVSAAIGLMGSPYRRGGNSTDTGFDCSGFTRHVFETGLGVMLPRTSREQARAASLVPVTREELRPGDLVFFNTVQAAFSHVGIYLGDHKFIHAPRTGGQIRVEDLRVGYWHKRFDGGRRAAKIAGGTATGWPVTTAAAEAPPLSGTGTAPQAAADPQAAPTATAPTVASTPP